MMHFWAGWRRERDGGPPPVSGLTGPPELVEPPPDEGPKSLRERWAEIRQAVAGTMAALPRVIRLVWQASPGLTIALFVVTAISGVVPAATAYTAKLLINSVLNGIDVHARHLPDRATLDIPLGLLTLHSPVLTTTGVIVLLAVIQLAIMAFSSLLGTIATSPSSSSRSSCRCGSS
jgi:ATP-binding cassette subfamily B protein